MVDRMGCRYIVAPFFRIVSASKRLPLPWIDRHRQRRVAELLLLLWLFSAVDVVLTIWAKRYTLFDEYNPLARTLLDGGYLRGVVLFKLAMLGSGSVILWLTRRHRASEVALWLLTFAHVFLMFQWSAYTAHAAEFAETKQRTEYAMTPTIRNWDEYLKNQSSTKARHVVRHAGVAVAWTPTAPFGSSMPVAR
jgi:hypothetical protein